MLKTTHLICFCRTCFLVPALCLCQQFSTFAQQETIVKDLLERMAPDLPEDYDLSELAERMNYFLAHPIDLNRTTAEELKKLVFLSPLQISNFFTHVHANGKLIALEELQSIDAFDVQTIQNLLPFVTLASSAGQSHVNLKNLIDKGSGDFTLRFAQTLEKHKGFEELPGSRYLGSPERLLAKFRFTYADRLLVSAVMKKDAGEELFRGSNPYTLDFTSFSVGLNNTGLLKKLVLGDYSLQFGQGLTLWSGFSFGKGPDVTSAAKKDLGLKAYASSNESSFFRGVAATVSCSGNFLFTPFFSYRKLDASLKDLENGESGQVNISVSGLHRTKTELKNRNSLGLLAYGGALQYLSNNLSLGIVAIRSHYSREFTTGTQLYNAKGFTGKELTNIGFHYNYTFKNTYFFGEVANSFNGGMTFITGAMASLSPSISAVLVRRSYGVDYHSYFSQSLGETTEAANEKGWYAGLNYTPNRQWAASIYTDLFSSPWLKYRVNAPSKGYEASSQLQYSPTKTFKITARYKIKQNQQNSDSKASEKYLEEVKKQNYKLEVHWRLNKKFSFQSRAEVCNYRKGAAGMETGYLLAQDADYSPLSSRISGNIRLAYFRTDSYNSRLYAYEDDVLHSSSFGMYNGTGYRTYLNLKYRLMRKLDLWARYAIFIYPGLEGIGSGLDQIDGNRKSEVKFQLRYQF